MKIISVRNVGHALPAGLRLLKNEGWSRNSRNGPVYVAPWPVTTVYQCPSEKVAFWPVRDTNIAFLIYEALWMLAGRNDLEPLTRYIKDFSRYSDDGKTLHGAYGYRWRNHLNSIHHEKRIGRLDQLDTIAQRLKHDPEDRRSVLQMWDAEYDLDYPSKDVPCNVTATFQRDVNGRLDLTVFNRSNDVIWGAYFANAFHFACLLEYVANKIGCDIGVYRQVSVNYHAYHATFHPTWEGVQGREYPDPYMSEQALPISLRAVPPKHLDAEIAFVLAAADQGFTAMQTPENLSPVMRVAFNVLLAHELWRKIPGPERFSEPLKLLDTVPLQHADWVIAMKQWLKNRQAAWITKHHTVK